MKIEKKKITISTNSVDDRFENIECILKIIYKIFM